MARVSVCVRFRPPSRREQAEDQSSCVQRASNESFAWKNDREGSLFFTFDRIFYPDAQQAEIFDYVAEPIVRGHFFSQRSLGTCRQLDCNAPQLQTLCSSIVIATPVLAGAFAGINGSILAYGQGPNEGPRMSLGHPEDDGILPRLAKAIFAAIRAADPKVEFVIKLAMVTPAAREKHTRIVPVHAFRDLLDTDKDNLLIKEGKDEGIYIAGATEAFVQTELASSTGLWLRLVYSPCTDHHPLVANYKSSVACPACCGAFVYRNDPADMNEESSRSHCVYMVTIQQESIDDQSVRVGKLHFVDLAGSEKVVKSSAHGHLVDEAKTINKSLSALGNVINALTDGRKLSDLPAVLLLSQRLQRCRDTLHFAIRAAEVKTEPTVNEQRPSGTLQQKLDAAVEECNALRAQVLDLSIHQLQRYLCLCASDGANTSNKSTRMEIGATTYQLNLSSWIKTMPSLCWRADDSLLSLVEKSVQDWNLDLSA
eukprot:SM000088S23682  [mRNA]  locus=s88:379:4107:- [translate_table: standard]